MALDLIANEIVGRLYFLIGLFFYFHCIFFIAVIRNGDFR